MTQDEATIKSNASADGPAPNSPKIPIDPAEFAAIRADGYEPVEVRRGNAGDIAWVNSRPYTFKHGCDSPCLIIRPAEPPIEWTTPTNEHAGKGLRCRVREGDDDSWTPDRVFLVVVPDGRFISCRQDGMYITTWTQCQIRTRAGVAVENE